MQALLKAAPALLVVACIVAFIQWRGKESALTAWERNCDEMDRAAVGVVGADIQTAVIDELMMLCGPESYAGRHFDDY